MQQEFSPLDGAYVVTGPTSGIGLCAAMELSRHGPVILVGRNGDRLDAVSGRIAEQGGRATPVVCDIADPVSVRRAVAKILALDCRICGLLNNAGIMSTQAARNVTGWDLSFATNHLGPFLLTESLLPKIPDGAQVLFVVSALEDPQRAPARVMGMRGGRFISVEAAVRGEWLEGGSRIPGIDAYATAKQCALAATLALAREHPRLRINAVEPGINPDTGLGGGNAAMRFVMSQIITRLPPFRQFRSTPDRAGRVIASILVSPSARSGIYFDEKGLPMRGSSLVHDPIFQDRVLGETRAFLGRHVLPDGSVA